MGLAEYRKKRDFSLTREPPGRAAKPGSRLRYVVQHHFASREHYDFRLELDGVLRSWAVPKEPGKATGERRLAVQVEDHPLEYGSFEGTIPEGQYGAGEVFLWDRGMWKPEGDPREGLKRGKLDFTLTGRKLAGRMDPGTDAERTGFEETQLAPDPAQYYQAAPFLAARGQACPRALSRFPGSFLPSLLPWSPRYPTDPTGSMR